MVEGSEGTGESCHPYGGPVEPRLFKNVASNLLRKQGPTTPRSHSSNTGVHFLKKSTGGRDVVSESIPATLMFRSSAKGAGFAQGQRVVKIQRKITKARERRDEGCGYGKASYIGVHRIELWGRSLLNTSWPSSPQMFSRANSWACLSHHMTPV